jgi:hypothetical protein
LCWPRRLAAADSDDFTSALCLVVALTIVVIPMTALYNQVLLLPALLLLAKNSPPVASRPYAILRMSGFALLAWPWAMSAALMLASSVVAAAKIQSFWKLPFEATISFPLFVFATIAWRLAIPSRSGST